MELNHRPAEAEVYLEDINPYTKGIILVKTNDKYIGFINYDSGESYWYFFNTLDVVDAQEIGPTFLQLVDNLNIKFNSKLKYELIQFN